MTRPFFRVLTAASALGVLAACSSSSPSPAPLPQGVYGSYVANGDVAGYDGIAAIDFIDAEHYSLSRTSGSEDFYTETGTYVLDPATKMLVLHNSATGEAETIPFEGGAVSEGSPLMESSGDLRPLGTGLTVTGSITLSGADASLVSFQVVCSFSLGNQGGSGTQLSFQNVSLSGCTATATTGGGSSGSGSIAGNGNGNSSSNGNGGSGTSLTSGGDGGTSLGASMDGGTKLSENAGNCVPAVYHSFNSGGTAQTIFATIKTVPNAATTNAYAAHGTPAAQVPQCFIDMNNVVDGLTGKTLGKNVKVSEHYTLAQLTQTGSSPDEFVVLDNNSVRALEAFASKFGTPSVISGFRGPVHQAAVCQSLCGAISCCGSKPQSGSCQVTCAKSSRHMLGKAFDLGSQYLKAPYIQGACTAGFTFVYNESNHLHVDTNFAAGSCVKQGL